MSGWICSIPRPFTSASSDTRCALFDNYNNEFGNLTVADCTFNGNIAADGMGGGIYCYKGDLTLSNSTFNLNSASEEGGALAHDYHTATVTNCTFTQNASYSSGGGIYNYDSDLTLTN